MPVLYNKESGLAEDLPQEVANSALQGGTHEMPVISPKGERESVAQENFNEVVKQGYRQPKEAELKDMLSTAAHTGPGQQVLAGIEGLGRGVLGPASDVILKATGVNPEDIRKREEIYSGTHAIAEGVGLLGSGLAGVGLGGALNKAGAVIKASKDASFIAKVAAGAGRAAIENGLYQAQNETSKLIQNDPGQTTDNALAHIGMATALGAAIGAAGGGVGALWDSRAAQKAGKFIEDMKGMARQHLDIPQAAQYSDVPTSPFYKGDALQGEGLAYPSADYSTTAGGKAVNAIINNNLVSHMVGVVSGGVASAVHHPFLGYLFGKHTIGPMIEKALPAIIKPLLEADTNPGALKAALSYTMNAIKGEGLVNKAAATVFGESTNNVESVSDKERSKLQNHLEAIENSPEHMLNVGKDVGYYMPNHAQAMASSAMRTAQYLKSLKPVVAPQSPLDGPRIMHASEEAAYNRALDIAQRPLLITKAIKDGSITIADIQHLKNMYPSLYTALGQKLTNQMIDKKTDKGAIPYKTKLGLSAFLGQPLDSSMMPNAIMASQGQNLQPVMQQPKIGTAGKNMNKLDKLPAQSNTMTGVREQYRTSRH